MMKFVAVLEIENIGIYVSSSGYGFFYDPEICR